LYSLANYLRRKENAVPMSESEPVSRQSTVDPAPMTAGIRNFEQGIQLCWWIVLAVVIAVVVFIRIHLRAILLERDEGEYAYAGQLMLQGIPPYQLAYNMKFPGVYAAYALIMWIFGETSTGIHLGLVDCKHRQHRNCFFNCEATDRLDRRHRHGGQLRDSLG
jgi:hypothetical protein